MKKLTISKNRIKKYYSALSYRNTKPSLQKAIPIINNITIVEDTIRKLNDGITIINKFAPISNQSIHDFNEQKASVKTILILNQSNITNDSYFQSPNVNTSRYGTKHHDPNNNSNITKSFQRDDSKKLSHANDMFSFYSKKAPKNDAVRRFSEIKQISLINIKPRTAKLETGNMSKFNFDKDEDIFGPEIPILLSSSRNMSLLNLTNNFQRGSTRENLEFNYNSIRSFSKFNSNDLPHSHLHNNYLNNEMDLSRILSLCDMYDMCSERSISSKNIRSFGSIESPHISLCKRNSQDFSICKFNINYNDGDTFKISPLNKNKSKFYQSSLNAISSRRDSQSHSIISQINKINVSNSKLVSGISINNYSFDLMSTPRTNKKSSNSKSSIMSKFRNSVEEVENSNIEESYMNSVVTENSFEFKINTINK